MKSPQESSAIRRLKGELHPHAYLYSGGEEIKRQLGLERVTHIRTPAPKSLIPNWERGRERRGEGDNAA
jgi:hypothetical protein